MNMETRRHTLKIVCLFMCIPLGVLFLFYVAIVVYRIPFVVGEDKTAEAVERIHGMAITMDDVTGENLPPRPGEAEASATIEGIDANENGIRDDVERAIFDKYPNNAKTRAALLQYAMAMQMYMIEVVNSETWKAVTLQASEAYGCIYDLSQSLADASNRRELVKSYMFNTDSRSASYESSSRFQVSYTVPPSQCDVEAL